jgi:hypothetical protein
LFGKNKIVKIKRNRNNSKLVLPCNSLDQGTTAFMHWLSSEEKQSTNNPIILKEFVNNKYAILYDNNLADDVIVQTHAGIPQCETCHTDDCAHVGFTICVEQKYDNDGTLE